MAKYHYSLVVSVLDANGNREDSIEIDSGNNKNEIKKARTKIKEDIRQGKYDEHADLINRGETLAAEIEVRDIDTDDLLWIE